MSALYSPEQAEADRESIKTIRRVSTDLEFELMVPRGNNEPDWSPDWFKISQACIRIQMAAASINLRAEGLDFAPSPFAEPGPCINA